MAHVGDKLRLVLTGDLELPALLRDFFEESRVLERNCRLVGEALHQPDDRRIELARLASTQDERTEWLLRAEQRDNEVGPKPSFKHGVTQLVAGPLQKVGNLNWLSLGNDLAEAPFACRDIHLAQPCNDLFVEPGRLAKFKPGGLLAIVIERPGIGTRKMDRMIDDGLQHDLEIERRAYRSTNLAQGYEIAIAGLQLPKQPHVLDGDDGLVSEGGDELNLLVGKRPHGLPLQDHHADRRTFSEQWNSQHRALAADFGDLRHLVFGIAQNVSDLHGLAVQQGSPPERTRPRRDRVGLHERMVFR